MNNFRFLNEKHAQILADDGENLVCIPVDEDNRDYRELVEKGVAVAPHEPHEPPARAMRDPTKKELQDQLDEIQAQIARLP